MNNAKIAAAAALMIAAGSAAPAYAQSKAGNVLRAAGAVADALAPRREMVLPRAVTPEGQVLSPYLIAYNLAQMKYRVNDMRRQGYAYAVDATGPRGNRVILLVDGRSGVVLGQKVARWAPKVARLPRAPSSGLSDAWEFGAVVPEKAFDDWSRIQPASWTRVGPRMVAVQPSYAPYRAAVPYRAVGVTRNGRTVVARPKQHSGYNVKAADGRLIAAQNQAEEAEEARLIAEADADDADLRALDAEDVANQALDERDDANANAEAALDFADEQTAALNATQAQLEETQRALDETNRDIQSGVYSNNGDAADDPTVGDAVQGDDQQADDPGQDDDQQADGNDQNDDQQADDPGQDDQQADDGDPGGGDEADDPGQDDMGDQDDGGGDAGDDGDPGAA